MMHLDARLAIVAARQHGVFTGAQARALGFSADMISRRVTRGFWLRLAPGVFAVTSAPPTWERQMSAAVLSRPEAIVAGPSAAYLQGFHGARPGRPTIVVPGNGNARSPLADVIRSKHFAEMRSHRVKGFAVTSPAETVLALAPKSSFSDLERLVDDALLSRSASIEDFDRLRGRHVPGSTILGRIIDLRRATAYQPPTSELERLLEPIISHPDVPPVSRQHPLLHNGISSVVDCFVGAWLLIVEADGRRWHSRQADFERDRTRDNAATAVGIATLRFTWDMLKRRPQECLAVLLQTGRSHRR